MKNIKAILDTDLPSCECEFDDDTQEETESLLRDAMWNFIEWSNLVDQ